MIRDKLKLFALLLIMPSLAFASGDFVLPTLYLQLGSIVIVVFFIVFIKLQRKGKLILVWVYLGTVFLIWYLIGNMPFLENEERINLYIGLIPIMTVLVAFAMLFKWFKVVIPDSITTHIVEHSSDQTT